MSRPIFYASLEGAQHGDKDLATLAKFAKANGCQGVQPSNYHLLKPDGKLMTAAEIKQIMDAAGIRLDGISAHCWYWCFLSAWTGTPGVRPFLPEPVWKGGADKIEGYCEEQILALQELSVELGLFVQPMFWGLAYGLEVATGYPWPFFKGPGYDLLAEGDERFAKKTEKIRANARRLKLSLAHEIHPGTAAQCSADFERLLAVCDDDPCLGVNADCSHCWDGETFETRFAAGTKVGSRVTGCHVKDHKIVAGRSLRMNNGDWKKRAMAFCRLGEGGIDLARYAQVMLDNGYAARYCAAHGTEQAPLVGEAESGYYTVDGTAADACRYIAGTLCQPLAAGSFEDAMGSK